MKKEPNKQVMEVPFYKIEGAGNDFLVFETRHFSGPTEGKAAFVRAISHRQLGLGADQVLELTSRDPLAIQIWNCDGTQAEMCANGSRTFAFLAAHEGWVDSTLADFPLEVSGASYRCYKADSGYELSLGAPKLEGEISLALEGDFIPVQKVSVGNPHAVIFCASPMDWDLPRDFDYKIWGAKIEKDPAFPKKTNVEFVREMSASGDTATLLVEVWERGAGATLSCGSGAVAAARAARQRLPNATLFLIQMNQFVLRVKFKGDEAFLSGPSTLIASGNYFYSIG